MREKFSLIILFISLVAVSQSKYLVTAKSGLSVRNKPSINASRIGRLDFNEKITITETTDFSFTTEKIKGYWVKIKNPKLEGYVFNGFLKPLSPNKITYKIHRKDGDIHEELRAKIDGKEMSITKGCFSILEVQDYNNDGLEDVLLEHDACGGNCCGASISIYAFNGKEFVATKQVGYDFTGIGLHYDKNTVRQFAISNNHIGHGNTDLCEDERNTYVFDNFEFKLIHTEKDRKLKAIKEIKSEDFLPDEFGRESRETEVLSIAYDLDNNGTPDQITSGYWSRWGILHEVDIILNGKVLKNQKIGSPKRVGILKTKTNNVHDLVIECDKIFVWNGKKYVYDKKKSKTK
ncbi:SH3 domain-containing protein [Tenacibaculum jejuense]|uniref:SH3b domain-containing protein n=1 Tax=Tenacibaculum jejuense TaxID=584609 RepID=A0A238UAK0_9FLAO|nr:SH3 domain-containing protein [Tenacibaculum jejuense]SNR16223.1 Protein of unknown function [Tenacibaculum jejuense]